MNENSIKLSFLQESSAKYLRYYSCLQEEKRCASRVAAEAEAMYRFYVLTFATSLLNNAPTGEGTEIVLFQHELNRFLEKVQASQSEIQSFQKSAAYVQIQRHNTQVSFEINALIQELKEYRWTSSSLYSDLIKTKLRSIIKEWIALREAILPIRKLAEKTTERK